MATIKVTKKNWSYMNTVTQSSSDNLYITYENVIKEYTAIDFDLSQTDSDYFVRNGNDLTIISTFANGKVVSNTVQNYFKIAPKYGWVVNVTQTGDFMDASTYDYAWVLSNLASANTKFGQIVDSSATTDETIIGTKAADSYKITNASIENGTGNDLVYDFAGNDTYLIAAHHKNKNKYVEIHDSKGNDNYNFENKTYSKVFDAKGNDVYYSNNESALEIEDLAGKDSYIFHDKSTFVVTDNAGNDNYVVYDAGNESSKIDDLKGNDKFEFVKADKVTITDKGGNDKYTLTSGKETTINDMAGKETYILTAEKNDTINDDAGNDKYTISASEGITITDKAGKDTYNVSYTKDLDLQDGLDGETKSGNDKYNLSFISYKDVTKSQVTDFAGNDKYNVTYSDKLDINDKKGSDSYVVKDSIDVIINDKGIAEKVGKKINKKLANDKYTITNSTGYIGDKEGTDTYKLTNTDALIDDHAGNDKYTVSGYHKDVVSINDYNASGDSYKLTNTVAYIQDDGGKDSYNITSGFANIKDYGESAKDSYTANMSGQVHIDDDGGSGDTLKLNGAKKGNIVFMADYTDDSDRYPGAVYSGNLIIFDKTTNGFVEIKDYFSMESSYLRYTDDTKTKITTETGCIETIYAGKSNVTSNIYKQLSGANVDAISADVADWLSNDDHAYDSVSKLIETGTTADITDFIATFVQQ